MDDFRRRDIRKAIEVLKTRTGELQCRAAEIEQEISNLQKETKELESQIAPVHMLPQELLVEIWSYNCSIDEFLKVERWSRCSFPMVASWVTQYWRNVAINTPTLWCHISLTPERSVELVKTQLERSGSCLLSVEAFFTSLTDESTTEAIRKARMIHHLTTLSAHIDRWYLFDLEWPGYEEEADPLRSLRDVCARQLKHMRVEYPGGRVQLLRGGTPALTHGCFKRISLRTTLPLLTGLTSLYLDDAFESLSHAEFKAVMDASPNLNHLVLNSACIDYSSTAIVDLDYPAIHIPSLRSLGIYCPQSYSYVKNFFSTLFAPELRVLHLEDWEMESLEVFMTVVSTSSGSLKYPRLSALGLYDVKTSFIVSEDDESDDSDSEEDCLIDLLQCFRSINCLQFDQQVTYIETSVFLKALTCHDACDSSDEVLCPRLHTLVWLQPDLEDEPSVREFILRRISMGYPISRLGVNASHWDYIGSTAQDWYRAHVEVDMYRDGRRVNEFVESPFPENAGF